MIYFDNAATTFKKPKCVVREVEKCIKKYCGNPGRSAHRLSVSAGEKIYETREAIANLLKLENCENIVFTLNATYALNMAIKGLVREKCHIIISDIEHNSVLRPVYTLCRDYEVEYSVFDSSKTNIEAEIESHIRKDTKFIISTLASNVNGREIPLRVLSAIKQKHNLKLIIDASQMIGHKEINLSRYKFDALCAPAHKALFGIQGCGFCVFSAKEYIDTLVEGGSGSESRSPFMPEHLPERMEAGTLCTPAIASLCEGIRFIDSVGLDEISAKLEILTSKTLDILQSIPEIKIYGGNSGVISFTYEKLSAEALSAILDKNGVCVRAGLHCAPLAHDSIGSRTGSVRISYSYFNSEKEIQRFYKILKSIC